MPQASEGRAAVAIWAPIPKKSYGMREPHMQQVRAHARDNAVQALGVVADKAARDLLHLCVQQQIAIFVKYAVGHTQRVGKNRAGLKREGGGLREVSPANCSGVAARELSIGKGRVP